jgi:hypothetical protein
MTGATSRIGTADPSGTLEFIHIFSGNCVAQSSWRVPLVEQALLTSGTCHEDWVTQTPLKTWGELKCSWRVSSSCSTSGTHHEDWSTQTPLKHGWTCCSIFSFVNHCLSFLCCIYCLSFFDKRNLKHLVSSNFSYGQLNFIFWLNVLKYRFTRCQHCHFWRNLLLIYRVNVLLIFKWGHPATFDETSCWFTE